ncbi:MAG: C4-type zinc ribbon domain-containing protein [Bacteroidales bacterium]|nr:C4-type zinc ribbon domain-containing protein [Bacteroidales bacterium]
MATTKKTVKIQTPIDERETFVSLQKSFAESEQNTQEKLKTLYELQAADNEIERLVQLRGELPAEVAVLEDEIAGLKGKSSHIEELVNGYVQTIDSARKQIVELDADIQKYNEQLANITNSREYDSINKEIENQGLLRAICEKNISEAKAAIEERKAELERIGDRITLREDDLAAKKEELSTIVESTAKEEKALREKRDACAAKIDDRTLRAYERICASVQNHLAVVPVFNEDSCGGCFCTITPQRLIDIASGKKLVICEHCGRIIVNPEI